MTMGHEAKVVMINSGHTLISMSTERLSNAMVTGTLYIGCLQSLVIRTIRFVSQLPT